MYGSSDSGRQYDTSTGTSTNTYKWYLQEVRDTNGNYIKYTYTRDSNQIYPNQIIYTGNGVTDGPATISFTTATRPDARISFAPGFKETTNYRISEIDASFNGQVVRKYLLGYGAGNNGYRSLLTSLQEQGYDDNQTLTSLPATTFSYISATSSFLTQNGVSEFELRRRRHQRQRHQRRLGHVWQAAPWVASSTARSLAAPRPTIGPAPAPRPTTTTRPGSAACASSTSMPTARPTSCVATTTTPRIPSTRNS